MAKTLTFNGVPIGDQVIRWRDVSQAQTDVVVIVGLERDTARIVSTGRNMLFGVEVTLLLVRDAEDELQTALRPILSLANQSGRLQILRDGTPVVAPATDWICRRVAPPPTEPGFGGRLTQELILEFSGESPP